MVTYYTAFLIELHSRRVRLLGTTPSPDEAFVIQTLRQVTGPGTGPVRNGRILIGDRDPKGSRAAEPFLTMAGVRMVRTPARAPNCNAYAERFVRSIKEECLNRIVPLVSGIYEALLQSMSRTITANETTKGLRMK